MIVFRILKIGVPVIYENKEVKEKRFFGFVIFFFLLITATLLLNLKFVMLDLRQHFHDYS